MAAPPPFDCSGGIDSLVELLQGRLSKAVMDRVCRQGDGLFPAPREIKLSCSCPDSASMCKHVAAVLYGVGARLDDQPELLFVLRDVDEKELIAGGVGTGIMTSAAPARAKVLADVDVAAMFGLDMAPAPAVSAPTPRSRSTSSRKAKANKAKNRAGICLASRAKAPRKPR